MSPVGRRIEGVPSQHLARVERELAGGGLAPHSISLRAIEHGQVVADVTFEPAPTGARPPQLMLPRPFRDVAGRPFWETLGSDLASRTLVDLTALGAPTSDDGRGLTIAGVLAGGPPVRVAWAVHLDRATTLEAWDGSAEVATLRRVGEARRAMRVGEAHVLSLWNDPDPARRARWIGGARDDGRGPLDAWMFGLLERTGAARGWLYVERADRVVHHEAYALTLDAARGARASDVVRLGSLSKVVTVMTLERVLSLRGRSLDDPIDDPLAATLAGPRGPLTYRALVEHRAGFPSCRDIRHDDPANPLAEVVLTRALHGAPRPAQPGDLLRFLRSHGGRPAWLGASGEVAYSNEGYVLLGEHLAELVTGDPGAFERVAADVLFGDPTLALCLGAGEQAARLRGEPPVEPSVPTWAMGRFGVAAPTLPPYSYNGPFLGPAAGLALPLAVFARALRKALPRRVSMDAATSTASMWAVHGLYTGDRGYWNTKYKSGAVRSTRYARFHHNGRVEGGSSLLVHQCPLDEEEGPSVVVLVAISRLGALSYATEGREIFEILKRLEGTWPEA